MKVQEILHQRLLPQFNNLTSMVFAVILLFLMIQLFQHKPPPEEIYAMSLLLFVLGALRIASTLVHQRERTDQAKASTHSG